MSERNKLIPVIEGFDCAELVNPWSFCCEQVYVQGDNDGTLLDGTTVHDILAVHARLSWTLNVSTPERYAALSAALNSAQSLGAVRVIFYDPNCDAIRLAHCLATRPTVRVIRNFGQFIAIPQSGLTLEESEPIARFAVTPPTQTVYAVGDSFAFAATGMSVIAYDAANAGTEIASQCVVVPADGSKAQSVGNIRVSVSYEGVEIGAFSVNVAELEIVASGDWWELYNNASLRVFCKGNMPDFSSSGRPPWEAYDTPVKTAVLSDGVTSVGNYAFNWRSTLTSVTIPDSVTNIGSYAFRHCQSLTSVTIPRGVVSVGDNAFYECSTLTSVTIPDSVTNIGSHAFGYCSSLTSVTIPDSVTNIGASVFYACSALTSLAIPNGVASVPDTLCYNCRALTSVTIPDGVTSIGEGAFYNCYALTSVAIPDGVTSIGYMAFEECAALTSVTIPASVTNIGNNAFYRCLALDDVYFSGTQAQWEAISVGSGNTGLARATIHYDSV